MDAVYETEQKHLSLGDYGVLLQNSILSHDIDNRNI